MTNIPTSVPQNRNSLFAISRLTICPFERPIRKASLLLRWPPNQTILLRFGREEVLTFQLRLKSSEAPGKSPALFSLPGLMAPAVRKFKNKRSCPLGLGPEIMACDTRCEGCSAFPLDPGMYFNKNVYSPEDLRREGSV